MKGNENRLLGRWGEERAAEWMRRHGFVILAAGYHCRFGEIDLIASRGKYICFTEVKLRKSDKFASAREFVDIYKQNKIKITAEAYLAEHPTELQPRFDVVEIYAPEGKMTARPKIVYLENAF